MRGSKLKAAKAVVRRGYVGRRTVPYSSTLSLLCTTGVRWYTRKIQLMRCDGSVGPLLDC